MAKAFITLHIVNDVPWANLNRDDSGTPKRTILGGVERGLLSSQALKRAARRDYEARILEVFPEACVEYEGLASSEAISKHASMRSRYLVQWAVERAEKLAQEAGVAFNRKKATTLATSVTKKLTNSKAKETESGKAGKDTILWLSVEELEALALVLLQEQHLTEEEAFQKVFFKNKKTGALAIAAFGRMFANAQEKSTDAALAVSPAISTHGNIIETDYFIAADDYGFFAKSEGETTRSGSGAGAAHLGTALYTNGIFYRTVTIDVKELQRTWTGFTSDDARKHLEVLVESLLRSLPTGKKNSTAPYTVPTLVIAEEQGYREAYSIAKPLAATPEGGFLEPTVEHLKRQHELARSFNGSNYGEVAYSGSEAGAFTDEVLPLHKLVSQVVEWILSYEAPKYQEVLFSEELPSEGLEASEASGESKVAEELKEEEAFPTPASESL